MISRLTLENVKAHRHTEIDLGRLTLLVGPNGAGKTTVLEALDAMVEAWRTRSFSKELPPRVGATDPTSWGMTVVEGEVSRAVSFRQIPGQALQWECPLPSDEAPWCRLFRFDAGRIAQPSYSDAPVPVVASDGTGTASTLAALKLAEEDSFAAIVRALSGVVPTLRNVRLRPAQATRPQPRNPVQPEPVMGHQIVLDVAGADGIAAPLASSGTLVALALLTALTGTMHAKKRLALIDDIELSLHPTAQTALMNQLQALLARDPDLQIVATTHSPYILDGIEPEKVWVFFPRANGEIAFKKLSDHPDAQRAKGTLSTGEIWTLDPESWVAEEAKER